MVQPYHKSMTVDVSRFRTDDHRARHLAVLQSAYDRLWPIARTETDVPTRYGTTRIVRSGTGGGAPLVLLPGAGGSSLMWYPHIAGLARDRTVLGVDPVGDPNASTQTAPITGGADLSRWLTEVLDGLGVERAHVAGCSYGGWVALRQHLDDPGRAASITLVDPAGFGRVSLRFIAWTIAGGLAMIGPSPVRRLGARVLHNSTLLDESLRPLIRGSFDFRRRLPAPEPLTDDDLRRVRAPTLALFGERSQLYDAAAVARRVEATIPGARTLVVPGASHDLPMHSPALIVEQILRNVDGADSVS